MKYSEKLENIPKESSQELTTYLSKLRDRDSAHTTRSQAARRSGLDERTVQTILSELTASGVLQAKIQIRCPYCNTQAGIYTRRSSVPNETEVCIDCGEEFKLSRESNWEVVYEVESDPGDFFRSTGTRLSYYTESERDMPASFFQTEIEEFKDRNDPQQRGRDFDPLMGLLFQQLPGVNVRLKGSTSTGEVDVHIECLTAPDWVVRLLGTQTIIENKWEDSSIGTKEVSGFRQKTTDIRSCKITYFASMSGFTTGSRKSRGATELIRSYNDPQMVALWKDDIEQMMLDGTPENVLRDRLINE